MSAHTTVLLNNKLTLDTGATRLDPGASMPETFEDQVLSIECRGLGNKAFSNMHKLERACSNEENNTKETIHMSCSVKELAWVERSLLEKSKKVVFIFSNHLVVTCRCTFCVFYMKYSVIFCMFSWLNVVKWHKKRKKVITRFISGWVHSEQVKYQVNLPVQHRVVLLVLPSLL